MGVLNINLKAGKTHVPGDPLSLSLHVHSSEDQIFAVINSIEIDRAQLLEGYDKDKFFGLTLKAF